MTLHFVTLGLFFCLLCPPALQVNHKTHIFSS
uniref:Uncharacterized protein n=1 Tax=Anguilla anguilla TaxID=7936 RepID=A0A0E9PT00_ANGAN